MDIWCKDPLTNVKSVTLTLLVISVINLIAMNVLMVLHKTDSAGVSLEFFGTCAALYMGRRSKLAKDTVTVDNSTDPGT